MMFTWLKAWANKKNIEKQSEEARVTSYLNKYEAILSLPMDDVRQQFYEGITTGEFKVQSAPWHDTNAILLVPKEIRELLSQFETIKIVETGKIVKRNGIRRFELLPQFTVVCEQVGETALCKSTGEEIYTIDEGVWPSDDLEAFYPSIYHWLLCDGIN